MNLKKIKRIAYRALVFVYLLSQFFQSFFYVDFGNKVYAKNNIEEQIDYTNLIAILVDDNIYNNLQDEIKRYAQNYTQGSNTIYASVTNAVSDVVRSITNAISSNPNDRVVNSTNYSKYNAISNSKAIVLNIDVDNITAREITQILENLYFDGIQGETSKLIGIVLIGDIPLPVVNDNGFVFPTIYPYVDFEDQKYIWDDLAQYFIYNDNKNGQAEIRHGLINFDTIQEYKQYFNKLQSYSEDPGNYIGKAIWYDDFIGNKKYFYDGGINSYVNNFLFAEDIGYRRYSDLMISIMQGAHNDSVSDVLQELAAAYSGYDIYSGTDYSGSYEDALQDFINSANNEKNTPNMTIKKILDEGYLDSYSSLFGAKFLSQISTNIETANRWYEQYSGSDGSTHTRTAMDSHYVKIEEKDETLLRMNGGLDPLLISINNVLEDFVDEQIQKQKYRLNEVIPLTYLNYVGARNNRSTCTWQTYDAFENYFFGRQAKYLTSMQDISTYRGTYRNYQGISGLTINDIQNSNLPSTDLDIDLNKKSVGGSYEIFAQQVDANRGYNINNSIKELNLYEENKTAARDQWSLKCEKKFLGICRKKRKWHYTSYTDSNGNSVFTPETPQAYAIRNRGGASPLNLDENMGWASGYNFQDAITPIYDIGGSKVVLTPKYEANSYQGVDTYTRLIQRKFVIKSYKKNGTDLRKKFFFKNKSQLDPDSNGKGYNSSMGEDVLFTNYLPSFTNSDGDSIDQDDDNFNRVYNTPKLANSVNYFTIFNSTPQAGRKVEGNIIKLSKTNGGQCKGNGQIYTYKTLDSRVKNTATNSVDIGGRSYNAFQDSESPIYQMYQSLEEQIGDLSIELANSPIASNSDGTGIIDNIQSLNSMISRSNNIINSIINTSESTISGWTDAQISQHAELRASAYNASTRQNISGTVEDIELSFQEIDSFFEYFSYESLSDYIENQLTEFKINDREFILLKSWRDNIVSQLLSTHQSFTSQTNNLHSWVNTAKNRYNTLEDTLDNSIFKNDSKVNSARSDLDDVLDDIKDLPGGCNGRYSSLCTAINNVRYYLNQSGKDVADRIKGQESAITSNRRNGIKVFYITKYKKNGTETGKKFKPFNEIGSSTDISDEIGSYSAILHLINNIPTTTNSGYQIQVEGMNITTEDRPIDSPKYITFKGIGGDKVTFIYPDLYKVEIFSGDSENLVLKSPDDIADAIRDYLRKVVMKYNEYITEQGNKSDEIYSNNQGAYNLLNNLDKLASPDHKGDNIRPYELFDEDYLIDKLVDKMNNNAFFSGNMGGYEPIEFIAHMMYYQNITWPEKTVGSTIQDDMDNDRVNFNINEKIEHVLDNYLIKDNNLGQFVTPGYRDNGYEVAYLNSDGEDYITYENKPPFIESVENSSINYKKPTTTQLEQTQQEEELINECNIPEDGEGVLLFDLSTGKSPRIQALKCRWEITKKKPISFEFSREVSLGTIFTPDYRSNGVGNEIQNMLGLDTVDDQFLNQLGYLNSNGNEELLNNVSGAEYNKLSNINTHVDIRASKETINADQPTTNISISSDVDVGKVYFYIQNIGSSKIKLYNGETVISNNITQGTTGYQTGVINFEPINQRELTLFIGEPIDGSNVLVFYMCMNETNNMESCIKKTQKINIVPGTISQIAIETPGDIVMEGSKIPVYVKGLDIYGNNVGQLVTERFVLNASTGYLLLGSQKGSSFTFSNFNESNYVLSAEGNNLSNKQIELTVSGSNNLSASKSIRVVKGKLTVTGSGYSSENNSSNAGRSISEISVTNRTPVASSVATKSGISKNTGNSSNSTNATTNNSNSVDDNSVLDIYLPDTDNYSFVDQYNITQANTGTIPTIQLRLTDTEGRLINLENIVSISSKKGLVKLGTITKKNITKLYNGSDIVVEQKRFSQSSNITINGGTATIYIVPTFVAGNDIITIQMPGVDPIEVPVTIHSASAKIVNVAVGSNTLHKNSSTDVNISIYDNWDNLVTQDTEIKIGTSGPISISGQNSTVGVVTIKNGSQSFTVDSKNKGGFGYIYALINDAPLGSQQAGYEKIVIQESLIPDGNLNIMYLNLYGSDWGNQWGFLSENNKYIQRLISNSDKILTATTQLISTDKLKFFDVIMDKNLNISNLFEENISLVVDYEGLNIEIEGIGRYIVPDDDFPLYEVGVSDENQGTMVENLINRHRNGNMIIYLPSEIDSVISQNTVNGSSILINGQTVLDLSRNLQSIDLDITLSDEKLLGYNIWDVSYNGVNVGEILVIINDNDYALGIESYNADYNFDTVWLGGSTNKIGYGFYEIDSKYDTSNIGYKSIQDSKDPSLGIGFVSDFKNITNFGAGQNVGDATKGFSSEFLINIGDPLLKMVDDNKTAKVYSDSGTVIEDTKFDKGLGQVIYSDPQKIIDQVVNIDFNSDGLEDLLVVYSDGSIRILKNYGGDNPFENLGDLMTLADGIKDIVVGDVDGNGYDDIIIWTNGDLLRVYHNHNGVFDVDGYPICLNINVHNGEISSSPEKVTGLYQIFFEDMDNDGSLDIVTNDSLGFVKIFYGGKNNIFNKDNYVSTNQYMCDENWYYRLSNSSRTSNNILNTTITTTNSVLNSASANSAVSSLSNNIGRTNTNTSNSNINDIYRFGIQISDGLEILDQSLIRRKGISDTGNTIEITPEDLGVNTNALNPPTPQIDKNTKMNDIMDQINIEGILGSVTSLDVDKASDLYKLDEARYTNTNFGVIPYYESNIDRESDVKYVEIGCLTGNDPIKVYKEYSDLNGDVLEPGDKVEVTVTLKANRRFVGTFIDNIVGPWIIPLTGENKMIENFRFESGGIITETKINNELKFYRDLQTNARYMIDNIILNPGDEIKIHYRMYYDGETQLTQIKIQDINGNLYNRMGSDNEMLDEYDKDSYLDIATQPTDGCNGSMFIFFNEGRNKERKYQLEVADLSKNISLAAQSSENNYNSAMNDITNSMAGVARDYNGSNINLSSIPGADSIVEVSDAVRDMFSNSFDINNGLDLTQILDIPMTFVDGLLGDVTNKIEDVINGLCGGFNLGSLLGYSSCNTYIPFNESFFGAGDYHIFGCFDIEPLTQLIGKGMPFLNIPGNRAWQFSPETYLPAPGFFGFPYKAVETDGFGIDPLQKAFEQPNAIPSMFRLYVMPTLTAQIGFALCFGPYASTLALRDPFGSVGGNCVVFAVPIPCGGSDNDDEQTEGDSTFAPQEVDQYANNVACSMENIPCYVGAGQSSTPFQLAGGSTNSQGNDNLMTSLVEGGYLGGLITIEKHPETAMGYDNESFLSIGGIPLEGGSEQNKIIGSMVKGLIEKVVKAWLDKQIKYIMNNLTNFKIGITWPDFTSLVDGFQNLEKNAETIKNMYSKEDKQELSEEQKCINKGKSWENGSCVKKKNQTKNDKGLESIQSWAQDHWISEGQVENRSESKFANPFEALEVLFEDVPLIDISTQDITVQIPLISSEDIMSYASLSQNWIEKQKKILEEWRDLFNGILGLCGGKEVKNWKELKQAVEELKQKLLSEITQTQEQLKATVTNLSEQLKLDPENQSLKLELAKANEQLGGASAEIDAISKRLAQIEKITSTYDLTTIGGYTLWERKDGKFLLEAGLTQINGEIMPVNVYFLYDPAGNGKLEMFTEGFDLIEKNKIGGKKVINIKRNGKPIKNGDLELKEFTLGNTNSCAELFLGGGLDAVLNGFLSMQSDTEGLITSVRQNLEILELYKKFPTELYEWIHVGERYLSEIAALVNSFLGTISRWMETNATRYTQYVNAIITIMSVLEVYQMIIDLPVEFNESCSTCTNDNYDQFTCKLGLLCPEGLLPVIPIPPMKIPSIFIDLSNINLGTQIKIPKFKFVTTDVPLPSLPDLPSPPSFDFNTSIEDGLSAGIDVVEQLIAALEGININLSIPSIPLIPSPPELPELPSFIPTVKMELPLLPPAPKIPKIPNELTATINIAKSIGKILCLVKKIPLVNETSVKAKIEQLTQRTYEVPYRDTMDQTFQEWGEKLLSSDSIMKSLFGEFLGFLNASEFENVKLKGFDISLESYVNLQYNFNGFYDFLNEVVGEVNKYTSMPFDYTEAGMNTLNSYSNDLTERMQVCIVDPVSEACLGSLYTDEVREIKENFLEYANKIADLGNTIKSTAREAELAVEKTSNAQDEYDKYVLQKKELENDRDNIKEQILQLQGDLQITTNQSRKVQLLTVITMYKNRLNSYDEQISSIEQLVESKGKEVEELNEKYGPIVESYKTLLQDYNVAYSTYGELKDQFNQIKETALSAVNQGISTVNNVVNNATSLDGISEWMEKNQKNMEQFDQKQQNAKELRAENLQNLFKEIDYDTLGYVDYDDEIFEEDMNILDQSMNLIDDISSSPETKQKVEKYRKLAKSDTNIYPATSEIDGIQQQYDTIISNYLQDTQKISELISDDYDKFLYAVKDNQVKLVSNDDVKITLSSKLFTMDEGVKKVFENQDSLDKMYFDYYQKNLDGYLNALNNYSAQELNMSDEVYELNKEYLQDIKGKAEIAYNILGGESTESMPLIAQNSNTNSSQTANSNPSYPNNLTQYMTYSNLLAGNFISTKEGSFILANEDFTKKFQGRSLMIDINNDDENDLILRDDHNIYIKYRNNNDSYDNTTYYGKYYLHNVESYEEGLSSNDDGIVDINGLDVKLYSDDREVKNFKYVGESFDDIKVSWMNSKILGDEPAGYLVKMIHRVDLFNDKEQIVNNSNRNFYDKKYVLVLPEGTEISGMKIELEEGTYNIEGLLSGLILYVTNYDDSASKINLTIKDIPRNWQYSEIFTLNLFRNKVYRINGTSSNQIVGGPQIIADNSTPSATIELYRPSIDEVIDEGEMFDGYVSTNYSLRANWSDNALLDKIWITDEDGIILEELDNLNSKTGYIELNNLFFTRAGIHYYYFVGTDINGNTETVEVVLSIQVPDIEITNINTYGTGLQSISQPSTITAEIDHDLDEGVVQFLRKRNNIWEIISGVISGIRSDKYYLEPNKTVITGGYYDFGENIGLYLSNGNLAAKLDPENGNIKVENGLQDTVKIELDYANKTPMIKVVENGNKTLFLIRFTSKELVDINVSNGVSIKNLDGEQFGTFNGGKAILMNNEILLYVSKNGTIYTDNYLYGDYMFDEASESVVYTFKTTRGGQTLGSIKVKIKNILE